MDTPRWGTALILPLLTEGLLADRDAVKDLYRVTALSMNNGCSVLAATPLVETDFAGATTDDAEPWDLDSDSVVARADLAFLLERYCAARVMTFDSGSALYLTPIEARLVRALERLELSFRPQVQIGRFTVDFLVGDRLVVECDGAGYHDYLSDHARDLELERLGYRVLRVSGGEIYRNAERCAAEAARSLSRTPQPRRHPPRLELSPSQGPAATHGEGPAWVAAPAGSGKTRVIQARVEHLLATGVDPARICAISFTNRAVDEMRSRLPEAAAEGTKFTTLHALAKEISELPPLGRKRGLVQHVTSARGTTRWALLKDALSPEEYRFHRSRDLWVDAISTFRTSYRVPDFAEFPEECRPSEERFREIHAAYEQALAERGLTDFEGMVLNAVRALSRDADFRALVAGRFDYWVVDEFQDLPPGKLALLRLLASPARNLFVVGDDDQVIYGFAGASPNAFANFDRALPDRVSYRLEENYRCPHELVVRSVWLVERNTDRVDKAVVPQRPLPPHDIATIAHADEYAEHGLRFVTACLAGGLQPEEVALLFRLRDMAVPVERLLAVNRIPHLRCARTSFFEREIVRRARAWLRATAGGANPADYSTALRWPNRYLRNELLTTLESSIDFAHALTRGHDEGLGWLETWAQQLPEANRHSVTEFVQTVRRARQSVSPAAILDRLELRRAAESLAAPANEAPPAIVMDVVQRLAAQFRTVDALEEWIGTRGHDKDYAFGHDDDVATVRSKKGKVTLATVHQVKGQEFAAVAVLGPPEGMPDRRAITPEQREEERRIAYVAVTRAKERLLWCASHQYADELDRGVTGRSWGDYRRDARRTRS